VLSTFALGMAIGGPSLSNVLRLMLSLGSVAMAYSANESRLAGNALSLKADRLRLQIEDLEASEEALEFANAKVSLEESYGLIAAESKPNTREDKSKDFIQEIDEFFSDSPEPWEASDDFGLSALAPDSKAEIRSWLTLDYACKNKVICAASGAGKSSYLKWEYNQSKTDRLTYLIDPHLRSNHLEERYWTGSKESDLRVVSHEPYQVAKVLATLIEEVKERLQGNRELIPTHVIIDEADGHAMQAPEVISLLREFVCLVANESRKAKLTLTFVVHSIQKQKCGLDASDLTQITWMIMGNSLSTPNSRWPSDLDAKGWRNKQKMLQDTLDIDQARALVIYNSQGTRLEVLERSAIE
jgi:hypothetical protein